MTAHDIIAPEVLRELGEWMALGFYEGLDLPWPRAYGLAYRRLFENMEAFVPADGFLTPFEPQAHSRTFASHGCGTASSLILNFDHNCGLRLDLGIAAEKVAAFPQHAGAIEAMTADLQKRLVHFGGYTHSNPDMRRVVNEGFLPMVQELEAELAAAGEEMGQAGSVDEGGDDRKEDERNAGGESLNLLLALQDYAAGVLAYHQTVARALSEAALAVRSESGQLGEPGQRAERLATMADSFANGFLSPASTFLEGLCAVNFAWMLDGCDSIGRFDQVLGPLFEEDLRKGTLDLAFTRQLLDELWQAFERLNGWNLQIGGYTPEGRDGVNALTYECIAACERNAVRRPNVAFRITKDTPDSALMAAVKALSAGSGRPALYNDDLYVDTLYSMDLGLSREDAREVGFGGCTETMIAGMSNVGSLEGEINLAKALELALNDGFDPVAKTQAGPHTGSLLDFTGMDDFKAAVKAQIRHMTEGFVASSRVELVKRFHAGDPKLARTMFTRDCVTRRKSFEAGGARYSWSVVSYQGIANLIDGLQAVRECVFERQTVGKVELVEALAADYVGHEETRQRLLAAGKFGNDDARVDELGREVIGYAWDELYSHETPRGGRYLPSCILFTTYLGAGKGVGATPDGRRAFEALTDSVGPVAGRDTHGPTAMLRSVTTLPLSRAIGTPVLNLRLPKSLMSTDVGLRAAATLVHSFFAQGGMQIQLSVVSAEELLAAQQNPEAYRDLIVRIGGYSEFFTSLPKGLQDSIIARTEHSV